MKKDFVPTRSSLGQQVVEYLREKIYSVEIPPGTQLSAVDIAAQLGLSRSPVRDALLILAAEGLVEQASSSGYKVIEFSESLIKDVFAVRMALEPLAIREGLLRFGTTFLDEHSDLWSSLDAERVSAEDWRGIYVDADNRLHETIINASENKLLREVLEKIIRLVMAIRHWQYIQSTPRQEIIVTVQEHLDIFVAVKSGDADRAAEALTIHLDNSRRRALSRFED